MSLPITDEEREAGAFLIWFGFGKDNQWTKKKTLAEIFAINARVLLELHRWEKKTGNHPAVKDGIERYFAVPRIAAEMEKVRQRESQHYRCKVKIEKSVKETQQRLLDFGM